MQTAWLVKKDPAYPRMTKFFGKLFPVYFAVGVITGIVQEFQLVFCQRLTRSGIPAGQAGAGLAGTRPGRAGAGLAGTRPGRAGNGGTGAGGTGAGGTGAGGQAPPGTRPGGTGPGSRPQPIPGQS